MPPVPTISVEDLLHEISAEAEDMEGALGPRPFSILSSPTPSQRKGISLCPESSLSSSTTPPPMSTQRRSSFTRLCEVADCFKRAQTKNRCITHGGGTRCRFTDCTKSSQARGLCKRHGGSRKCDVQTCGRAARTRGVGRVECPVV